MHLHHSTKTSAYARRAADVLTAAVLLFTPAALFAGDLSKELGKSVVEPEPGSRIHALIVNEFSDHYITPRGLNVENQGLVWQPLVLVFLNLYQAKSGFLTDVTLTGGVWNSVHSRRSGFEPSNHNELDPIAGIGFKFFSQLSFDATWTAFESETNSYDTSQNLSLKLTWNDKLFGDSFSINPYVEYWRELDNKDTVVFDGSRSDESYYFSVGINPTYKFKNLPLELSALTYVNIVDNDFYQRFDGSPGGGGAAVFSTQLKATVPLKFIPKQYGFWSIYAGFQYYHLDNAGLLDGNQALNADSRRAHSLYQWHGGLTVFF
jgi:hypothetical protein